MRRTKVCKRCVKKFSTRSDDRRLCYSCKPAATAHKMVARPRGKFVVGSLSDGLRKAGF